MREVYSHEECDRLEGRVKKAGMGALIALGAGLAVCVGLCVSVTTVHALALQWTTVAVSTVAGWIAIVLWWMVGVPTRKLAKHARGMLAGAREMACGTLRLTGERVQIPNSIAVCKVRLTDGEEERMLNVCAEKAALLPREGQRVRVQTVRRYVVAWEVCE